MIWDWRQLWSSEVVSINSHSKDNFNDSLPAEYHKNFYIIRWWNREIWPFCKKRKWKWILHKRTIFFLNQAAWRIFFSFCKLFENGMKAIVYNIAIYDGLKDFIVTSFTRKIAQLFSRVQCSLCFHFAYFHFVLSWPCDLLPWVLIWSQYIMSFYI